MLSANVTKLGSGLFVDGFGLVLTEPCFATEFEVGYNGSAWGCSEQNSCNPLFLCGVVGYSGLLAY